MSDAEMMRFMAGCMLAEGPAPSVETPLHSLLPHRVIAHTHDVATMSLTNVADGHGRTPGERAVRGRHRLRPLQPPRLPARPISRARWLDRIPPDAIGMTLAHHGLVVWGDDAEQAHARLVRVVAKIEEYIAASRRGRLSAGAPSSSRAPSSSSRAQRGTLPRNAPTPDERRGLAELVLPAVRGAPERAGPRDPPLRRRRRRARHPGRGADAGAHRARYGERRSTCSAPGGCRSGSTSTWRRPRTHSSPRCGAG